MTDHTEKETHGAHNTHESHDPRAIFFHIRDTLEAVIGRQLFLEYNDVKFMVARDELFARQAKLMDDDDVHQYGGGTRDISLYIGANVSHTNATFEYRQWDSDGRGASNWHLLGMDMDTIQETIIIDVQAYYNGERVYVPEPFETYDGRPDGCTTWRKTGLFRAIRDDKIWQVEPRKGDDPKRTLPDLQCMFWCGCRHGQMRALGTEYIGVGQRQLWKPPLGAYSNELTAFGQDSRNVPHGESWWFLDELCKGGLEEFQVRDLVYGMVLVNLIDGAMKHAHLSNVILRYVLPKSSFLGPCL